MREARWREVLVARPGYGAGKAGKPLGSSSGPLFTLLLSGTREKNVEENKSTKLFLCVSSPLEASSAWRSLGCGIKGEVAFLETFIPGNR